jgi:hypothetical protein
VVEVVASLAGVEVLGPAGFLACRILASRLA